MFINLSRKLNKYLCFVNMLGFRDLSIHGNVYIFRRDLHVVERYFLNICLIIVNIFKETKLYLFYYLLIFKFDTGELNKISTTKLMDLLQNLCTSSFLCHYYESGILQYFLNFDIKMTFVL